MASPHYCLYGGGSANPKCNPTQNINHNMVPPPGFEPGPLQILSLLPLPVGLRRHGGHRRTRTFNLVIRSHLLYPVELCVHWWARRDSNTRSIRYERTALTSKLQALSCAITLTHPSRTQRSSFAGTTQKPLFSCFGTRIFLPSNSD